MELIPKPDPKESTILIKTGPNFATKNPYAFIVGAGEIDYICGACGVTLAASVERGQIANMALKCAACKCFNAIRGS